MLWRKEFLEVRNSCYETMKDPLARRARRDLEEYLKGEAAAESVSDMTQKIREAESLTTGSK